MTLDSILADRGDVLDGLKAIDRKHALRGVAQHAADATGLDARALLAAPGAGEKDATLSAVGGGGAVLHAVPAGLGRPYVLLARLARPVPYGAPDGFPVDLFFLLLSPPEDGPLHLQRLSRLTRLLRDVDVRQALRDAESADELRALLACYAAPGARLAA